MNTTDEIYNLVRKKLDEMRKNGTERTAVDFSDMAKIYQLVCFMKQIRAIANGCESD